MGWSTVTKSRAKHREGHTLTNIQRALRDLNPPPDQEELKHLAAYDVFCGYLVLDALVANRDRHDHNWAVLILTERRLGCPRWQVPSR